MGVLGKLCGCSAISVAVLAILVGSLMTPLPEALGFFKYLDGHIDGSGNRALMGISPALHRGTKFGFELDQIPDLTGKVILVTGANSGLGLATATHLAGKGATVVLTCRFKSKCVEAAASIRLIHPAARLEPLALDLGSFKSIRQGAMEFNAAHTRLDSLILNAGIMMTPFGLTEDGFEQQMGVNHFGHFLLTQLLLPAVEAAATPQAPSTIVVLSSMAHFSSYPEGIRLTMDAINDPNTYGMAEAYGQSKLANVLFAQELATRVKKHVLVNAVHPGGVNTNLGHHVVASIDSSLGPLFGPAVSGALMAIMNAIWWDPEVASLSQIYAAIGPSLLAEGTTGRYFHPIARLASPCAKHAGNATLQKGLWELSEREVAKRAV